MKKFSNRIYYMEHEDANDEPNLFYIKGSKFSLQVDAGNSPESFQKFSSLLEEEGLEKPTFLVLTHWHWDHSFGMSKASCPIIATSKTQEYLSKAKMWKWTEEEMLHRLKTKEDIPFCYEKIHMAYEDISKIQVCLADIVIQKEMEINLGDIYCTCIPHDSPHTRDALFLYIKEEEVLIGGDAEYEDYYDNDSKYDKSRVRDFISFIEKLDFKYYLHGHDSVFLTKEALLEKMLRGLQ